MKKLAIKNMVCDRCKKVVKDEFEKLGLVVSSVELGNVTIENDEIIDLRVINEVLIANGFALIQDRDLALLEKIKHVLLDQINEIPINNKRNLSDIIAEAVGREYSSISRFFSKEEGVTIERYFQKLKLEKVKALIQEGELTFTEIAYQLDYTDSNHLARQFKMHTGMTMSQYHKLGAWDRASIDKIV